MSSAAKERPSSNIGKYIQLLGLLLALGVVGSSYMKKEGGKAHSAAQSSEGSTNNPASNPTSPAGSSRPEEEKSTTFLAEQVRPVIVSVKTSWGKASGFFIRKNFIITCKHVVEADLEKLAALQVQVKRNRQLLDFEEKKLSSYRARLKKRGRGSSKDGLKILILERERYLADFKAGQEKDELRLAEQQKNREHPALKIILSDGSEQSASLVQMSQEYDLALLISASVQSTPFLAPLPPNALLKTGDYLFVSSGSVVSGDPERNMPVGNFSGYRRVGIKNQMFLQVDAELSQDKSGGPVLDAAGYIRGVATGTVRGGKGVGFAIPIERVFDEFAAALH